jgi:hypothetical protein
VKVKGVQEGSKTKALSGIRWVSPEQCLTRLDTDRLVLGSDARADVVLYGARISYPFGQPRPDERRPAVVQRLSHGQLSERKPGERAGAGSLRAAAELLPAGESAGSRRGPARELAI